MYISSFFLGNYETPLQSSDDYNVIADQIINRVKNNLSVNRRSDREGSYEPEKEEVVVPVKHAPLSSHTCQKCHHLMVRFLKLY